MSDGDTHVPGRPFPGGPLPGRRLPDRPSPGEPEAGDHGPGECRRIGPVLQRVGDKWTILVVVVLGAGPLRFNELKRRVGGISQRMLTLTVRGLERDGFVARTMYPTIPPAVSYALTPMGRSLLDPVRVLGAWAREHIPAIEAAQERFDRHGPGSGWEPAGLQDAAE